MEFLKEILGDELYKQFETAINAHNGNEENKDKQIKLGNLGSGDYVGKGKFNDLQEVLTGKETELASANELITELKKSTKGNEDLQGKITAYETQVAELQAQLAETKLKAAIKVALLSEKAVDVEYLTFKLNEKLKEKGESLELDDNDNIKGWETQVAGLKTQFPTMFESASGSDGGEGGFKPLDNSGLPKGGNKKPVTKDEFHKMTYEQRAKLKEEDEQLFRKLAYN